MRKVNNYEIISLLMFINITMYLGININIIKITTGANAWLTVLISNIIGFIPLILFLYIANYKPELKLNEKINFLYKKTGFIINIFIFDLRICCVIFILSYFFVILSVHFQSADLILSMLIRCLIW